MLVCNCMTATCISINLQHLDSRVPACPLMQDVALALCPMVACVDHVPGLKVGGIFSIGLFFLS